MELFNYSLTQKHSHDSISSFNKVRYGTSISKCSHTVRSMVTLRSGLFFLDMSHTGWKRRTLLDDTSQSSIRELKQPRRRRQQKPHKCAYLIMKNRIFASFARHFSAFDILKTFSFFLRRQITCFAVVWTT